MSKHILAVTFVKIPSDKTKHILKKTIGSQKQRIGASETLHGIEIARLIRHLRFAISLLILYGSGSYYRKVACFDVKKWWMKSSLSLQKAPDKSWCCSAKQYFGKYFS